MPVLDGWRTVTTWEPSVEERRVLREVAMMVRMYRWEPWHAKQTEQSLLLVVKHPHRERWVRLVVPTAWVLNPPPGWLEFVHDDMQAVLDEMEVYEANEEDTWERGY